MAEEEDLEKPTEEAEEEGGGKSKKKTIIIAAAVLLLGGGLGFYFTQGNSESEKTTQEEAPKINEQFDLAKNLIAEKKYEDAKVIITALLAAKPKNIAYIISGVQLGLMMGQVRVAFPLAEQAIELAPRFRNRPCSF